MGKLIIFDEDTKNKIFDLYKSGIGSTTIGKSLNIGRPIITKLLKENGLLRNRNHSADFYSNFWEENGKWFGYWKCNDCNNQILFSVNKKCLINRTINKKKICKKCSLKKQIGEGNPFYGKKHSQESITKMLISQNKTFAPISNPEIEINKMLLNNNYDVKSQFFVGNRSFDFYLPKFNLLIEFNGDYWHSNPKIYDENYFNKTKQMLAKDIWIYDKNKLELAKKHNYNCEVIWENDYKKNKNIVLETIEKYNLNYE